jgi:HSP20 family protein
MENTNHSEQHAIATETRPTEPGRRYVRPAATVLETTNGFVMHVEMPGVRAQGLEITFENSELTLVGHRAESHTDTHGEARPVTLYRESAPADFRRVFELDSTIDAAHIEAHLEQGLLTLNLPKAEAAKPRRIQISGLN